LVGVFALAFTTATAVVPAATVQSWTDGTDDTHHAKGTAVNDNAHAHNHDGGTTSSLGLGLAEAGYRLSDVTAPGRAGQDGEIALEILGPDQRPVTDFDLSHDKELHLIVVRSDGQQFRHVHPERDDAGRWTTPWRWEEAGSYRVFADFVPAATGDGLTLSTTVQVAGDYVPRPADQVVTVAEVDGYQVTLTGRLTAGASGAVTATVTRDGEPVTTLEPYLGAFGHLVALRDGDLAYLHVHPHGDAAQAGETSGPQITFMATAPTPGRYLLFLDFQVDGRVHTAAFVVDAEAAEEHHEEGSHHDHH
jgi:hypothetical protein